MLKINLCICYITSWRYGLQFDIQRKRQGNSFVGHLWAWDYRRPWCITKQD